MYADEIFCCLDGSQIYIAYHTNRPEFDRVMIVCNEIEDHGMALRRSRFLPLETIPEDSPIKHTDML